MSCCIVLSGEVDRGTSEDEAFCDSDVSAAVSCVDCLLSKNPKTIVMC